MSKTKFWMELKTSNAGQAQKLRWQLRHQRLVVVDSETTLMHFSDMHHGGNWLDKIKHDLGIIKATRLAGNSVHYNAALCGQNILSDERGQDRLKRHQTSCKKCRSAAGLVKKAPRNTNTKKTDGKHVPFVVDPQMIIDAKSFVEARRPEEVPVPETVPVVEGMPSHTLDSLLLDMRVRFDDVMQLAQDIEDAIKAVDTLKKSDAEFAKLKEQRDESRRALVQFIEKEGVGTY
jgi:hypothetical protein